MAKDRTASAYQPFQPARRPGGRPKARPRYRVLVHRKFMTHWNEIVERVGIQAAQEFWDHAADSPGVPPPTAGTTILRGKAGQPKGPGWSRTVHYELSSKARINYQIHDSFKTAPDGDEHPVVAILTIDYSSH